MAHVRSYAPEKPCGYCGRTYRPRRDLLKRGSGLFCSPRCANKSRAAAIPADAVIAAMYRDDLLSIKEIQERFQTGYERIRDALRREGVELRPSGWRTPGRYRTIFAPDGSRVAEHRAVSAAPPGMVVHHINGLTRDNRPENLVVLGRSEHARAHKQLQELAFQLVRAGLIEWDGGSYICSSSLERLSKYA